MRLAIRILDWVGRVQTAYTITQLLWGVGGGAVVGVGVGFWSFLSHLPSPVVVVIGLAAWLIAVLLMLALAKLADRLFRNKTMSITKGDMPMVEIGTTINSITTSGYYDQAEGPDRRGGHPEGDKQVHIGIVLSPSKPMRLDRLSLQLWGKKFPPDWTAPIIDVVEQSVTTTAVFNVPKEFAKDTKAARIYALANGTEFFSEPFTLNFTESSK